MLARWRSVQVPILDENEEKENLAKSRVAPLKEITIPRLVLQATVLESRLGKTIQGESRFEFETVRYLTDSRFALAWVQGQTRNYKPFASTRVEKFKVTATLGMVQLSHRLERRRRYNERTVCQRIQ